MKIAFESLSFVLSVYIDFGSEVQMAALWYCSEKKDKRRSFPRDLENYVYIWEEEVRRQKEKHRRNKRSTIIKRQEDICN